jgi:hypothetical protein
MFCVHIAGDELGTLTHHFRQNGFAVSVNRWGLRELLAGIVVRITIQQDSIEVHVSKEGTRARLLNQERILGQGSAV